MVKRRHGFNGSYCYDGCYRDASGQPSQRIVLLKDVSEKVVFFTNLGSRKAQELAVNPKVSCHFPWFFMERQVRVCGSVEKLSISENAAYFFSRPKDSQLAAYASKQSKPIGNKELLLTQFKQLKDKFANKELPVPDFWGGFRIVPHQIEFWQGGKIGYMTALNTTKLKMARG